MGNQVCANQSVHQSTSQSLTQATPTDLNLVDSELHVASVLLASHGGGDGDVLEDVRAVLRRHNHVLLLHPLRLLPLLHIIPRAEKKRRSQVMGCGLQVYWGHLCARRNADWLRAMR